jgi:flagellar basal-body rod modification protein FlgD
MTSVAALPASIPTATTPGVKPHKSILDQSDFLALMTAQLKNQDPTKPVDNSEYVAQLAQFSTVSGITESNKALATIAAKLDDLIAAVTAPATIPATPQEG